MQSPSGGAIIDEAAVLAAASQSDTRTDLMSNLTEAYLLSDDLARWFLVSDRFSQTDGYKWQTGPSRLRGAALCERTAQKGRDAGANPRKLPGADRSFNRKTGPTCPGERETGPSESTNPDPARTFSIPRTPTTPVDPRGCVHFVLTPRLLISIDPNTGLEKTRQNRVGR